MSKLLLLLLLLYSASSLTSLSYTFPALTTSTYQKPSYSLGQLPGGGNLAITLTLLDSGSTFSAVTINVMDSTNTNSVQSISTASCTGTTCLMFWQVTSTNTYYLQVTAASPTLDDTNIYRYYLKATVNNLHVLGLVDILRQNVIKYFYLGASTPVTFTLNPFVSAVTTYLKLLTLTGSTASSSTLTATTTSGQIATYTQTLASGYYAVKVVTPATSYVKVTFQSDSYACPYSTGYGDYYSSFMNCNPQYTVPIGPPCLFYDNVNQVCIVCYNGYTLINGACQSSSAACGSRQYQYLGNCYNVSSTCGTFDPYTGNCRTCSNSSYALVNSQCIPSSIFCQSGYALVNGICVSVTCGQPDPTTGNCLTCINAAYYLSNGQCLPINCGSGYYYSVIKSGCTAIPRGCLNFTILNESCQICTTGYTLTLGVCNVNSNNQNCLIYNYVTNTCSICLAGYYNSGGSCLANPSCPTGQTPVNGVCASNANCTSNQVYMNNMCINLPPNCNSINTYQICTQCANNYVIVAGVCQACVGGSLNNPCVVC